MPLGTYLKQILTERGISGNQLAKSTGIAEGSVRNLLRYGIDSTAPFPQPQTLTAVADFLGLDTIELFQMAGYLPTEPRTSHISPRAEFFAMRFDRLPIEQQKVVMDMVISLEKAHGLSTPGEEVEQMIAVAQRLRDAHPMYEKWHFGLRGEIGRRLGHLTRTTTNAVLTQGILRRLHEYEDDPHLQAVREADLNRLIHHPKVVTLLNILLPRTDIPRAREKLFWLVNPEAKLDTPLEALSPEQQAGIRALWYTLQGVINHEHET